MNFYLRYLSFIHSKPLLLLILCILLLVAGKPALDIKLNNNMEDWFPSSSKQLVDKRQFIQKFGSDELMFLMLTFPDTSSSTYKVKVLAAISDKIVSLNGFEQVLSRSQLEALKPALSPEGLGKLEKLGQLYFPSMDSNCEMVYLKTRLLEEFDAYRPFLLDSLYAITSELSPSIQVDLAGPGVVFTEIDRISNEEPVVLFLICFILILVILWWRLRSLRDFGTAILVFLIVFWPAHSMFGWFDIPVNLITMVVPILLIMNFYAYILHILNRTIDNNEEFIKEKVPPILFSGLTTVIGFGSLMTSDMVVIYQFGLLTFSGILVGLFVLLLVGIPLVIKLSSSKLIESSSSGKVAVLENYYNGLTVSNSSKVSLVTVAFLVAGVIMFNKINVDTNSLHFLPEGNAVRTSTNFIEEHFGSHNTVDFLVTREDEQEFSDDDFKLMSGLSSKIGALSIVKGVISYSEWQAVISDLSRVDVDAADAIRSNYISADSTVVTFSLRIPVGSVNSMAADLEKVEAAILEVTASSKLEIRPVGYLPIYLEHIDSIVRGMLKSLALAILCITICMITMVKDVKLGLLALIPNTFPLACVAILMVIVGIPIDISTSIIGCVVIGLVVDDTLHIIWGYKKAKGSGLGSEVNLAKVMNKLVKPSTTTSLIFGFGFMVLAFSEVGSVRNFGLLVSSAILFAWVGDFIVYPAVLKAIFRKK